LWNDRIRAGATYFRRRSTDQIAGFPPANVGKVHTDGVELTLVAEPTPNLHVEASYTLTNAFNRSGLHSGKRLELRPQHSASLTADWTSPVGLTLGGTLTVVGDSFNDRANLVRIDGYTLVDLRASYPITETVELYGRVENLFDADYTIVRTSTGDAFNTYGRSAHAGVRARF
jgi:vitamin B12 transporter